ncbi:MAG: hypothetical protein OXL97_00820 [Chloroflexota bacterium]|nr:hypothetical protein [Chloroflexota bacterium]MDE2886055.1 hypothetical protein [Chloroflexota bacterium]
MKLGVTYLGNRFVRHYADRDLPEIVQAGCDYVVHTFSEYDLAFHPGEIGALVDATHRSGLEAWLDCWGLGGLFAGEAFSDFLLRHPESWQVRPTGERVPVACPNASAFRELVQDWIEAAAGAGADVVFFDDPLAPEEAACVCDGCRQARPTFPEAQDGRTFQQWSLARLIEAACDGARRQGLRTAVGVLPGPSLPEQLAAARAADVIAVSPLWRAHGQPVSPYVYDACTAVANACGDSGQEPMAWLQAFSIPAGREQEITQAAGAMAAAGIANVSTWCYRAGEQMTAVRAGQPQLAWETVVAVYRSFRAASSGA